MDGRDILSACGLEATDRRLLVVQALAAGHGPQTPLELQERLGGGLNRVTLYRILDLLVEHGAAMRHNAGERAFRYCLRPGAHGHAHFTCTRCGHTACLDAGALEPGLESLLSGLPMRVDSAELRFGGVCEACLGH